MSKILVNAWKCPDGTILESRHRHDFVSHVIPVNGAADKVYFVDGGTNYCRVSGEGIEFVGCYDTDPHEKIREVLSWGSYGRDGKQEKHYILLKDLTDEHVDAILRTQSHIKDTPIEKVLKDEQEYRKVNKIVVKDGL